MPRKRFEPGQAVEVRVYAPGRPRRQYWTAATYEREIPSTTATIRLHRVNLPGVGPDVAPTRRIRPRKTGDRG